MYSASRIGLYKLSEERIHNNCPSFFHDGSKSLFISLLSSHAGHHQVKTQRKEDFLPLWQMSWCLLHQTQRNAILWKSVMNNRDKSKNLSDSVPSMLKMFPVFLSWLYCNCTYGWRICAPRPATTLGGAARYISAGPHNRPLRSPDRRPSLLASWKFWWVFALVH